MDPISTVFSNIYMILERKICKFLIKSLVGTLEEIKNKDKIDKDNAGFINRTVILKFFLD